MLELQKKKKKIKNIKFIQRDSFIAYSRIFTAENENSSLTLSLVWEVSHWIILNHDSEAEVVKLKRVLYRIFVFEMNRVHQKPASISYFYYFNELKNDGLGVLICCDVFRSPGKNGIRRKVLRLFPFLILFHNFCAAVNSEAR